MGILRWFYGCFIGFYGGLMAFNGGLMGIFWWFNRI